MLPQADRATGKPSVMPPSAPRQGRRETVEWQIGSAKDSQDWQAPPLSALIVCDGSADGLSRILCGLRTIMLHEAGGAIWWAESRDARRLDCMGDHFGRVDRLVQPVPCWVTSVNNLRDDGAFAWFEVTGFARLGWLARRLGRLAGGFGSRPIRAIVALGSGDLAIAP